MRKYLLSARAVLPSLRGMRLLLPIRQQPKNGLTKNSSHQTLSKIEQMAEMKWFINASKPFVGMEVNVLSEGIPTHWL